jgi:hypothetical protein
MITIKDFMECVSYRITEGSNFCWKCYGPNAFNLDYWNGRPNGRDGRSVHVVFDTKTHVVYEMQACDEDAEKSWRWINPDFIKAVKKEYKARELDFKESLEDQQFIDFTSEEDMIAKAKAVANS